MTDRRWLVAVAVAGLTIFALSFVNAWIAHERELRGEGFRLVQIGLGAWRGVGMPVLSAAAVLALLVGLGAFASLRRPAAVAAWLLLAGACVTLALIAAAAWPIGQDGHASSVRLTVGPLVPVGVVLAAVMVVGCAAVARPSSPLVGALVALVVVAVGAGVGARWLGLQWAEGTGQHWDEGSYTRPATAAEPAMTLTIDDGRFSLGDRWSGTWEASGWTVVLDDDPACPGSRGTYHAHGEGESDLRFVKVVDTCEDGARAAALETGIWARDP